MKAFLLGVLAIAYVANAAPVRIPNKFQAAAIQDLLTALSKETDTTDHSDRSKSYDDSPSDDEDGDDYAGDENDADDTPPRTPDKYGPRSISDSLAVVSKLQAGIQDYLNVLALSMSDYDRNKLKSSSRYNGNEQDADEPEDKENYDGDEGAGDHMNAHEYNGYDNDRPSDSDNLALMRIKSALLENLPGPAKPRTNLLDYIMKVAYQVQPVGSPENGKYSAEDDSETESAIRDEDDYSTVDAQVAKAFINTLPEKMKEKIMAAILAKAAF